MNFGLYREIVENKHISGVKHEWLKPGSELSGIQDVSTQFTLWGKGTNSSNLFILQLFITARMNYSKRQIMSLPPSSSFPDFADTYLEHLKQALWKTSLLLSSRTTETRPSSRIKNPHTAHFSSSSVRSCRDLDWRLKKLRRNREGE